jgi:hypothetical protein
MTNDDNIFSVHVCGIGKVKVKVKADPLLTRHAKIGGTGITLPVLDPDARRRWVFSAKPRPPYPGKQTRYPFVV